jgi:glycerophosphoryl diester phosphodiesterase
VTRPQLIGHRGAPRERPENTLPAFLRALDLGAEAVELDVHATRDGAVVVHHDPVPRARAADPALAGRPIAELGLADLRGFVVEPDAAIPTLEEVLDALDGRVDVYVEIKGRGIERAVVETIRRSPAPARCAVHSFDHRAVKRARAMASELRGGILLVSALVDPAAALAAADAQDYWQQWDLIDAELIAAIHSRGGRVIAWTVNSADAARALTELGADAVCSDVLPVVRPAVWGGLVPRA